MVVARASAPDATRAVAPHMDEADIARLLQFHLKRVGCDPGAADGKWTDQSTRAMAEFNKRAKANFEVKVASLGALDAVKQQKERLCPLVCSKGFKVEEDRCVAEACKRGFVRSKSSGECERETKAAASPASRDEGGGGSGGGQIFCSERGGCNAVPRIAGSSTALGPADQARQARPDSGSCATSPCGRAGLAQRRIARRQIKFAPHTYKSAPPGLRRTP